MSDTDAVPMTEQELGESLAATLVWWAEEEERQRKAAESKAAGVTQGAEPQDEGFSINAIRAELKAHGYIATLWHVDDVIDIRPDLTRDQAMQLLEDLDIFQDDILETVKHDVISDMADTKVFDAEDADGAPDLAPAQPEIDVP